MNYNMLKIEDGMIGEIDGQGAYWYHGYKERNIYHLIVIIRAEILGNPGLLKLIYQTTIAEKFEDRGVNEVSVGLKDPVENQILVLKQLGCTECQTVENLVEGATIYSCDRINFEIHTTNSTN